MRHFELVASFSNSFLFILFYFFAFLGLQPQHMEVPRLEAESELQLPACATATAMQDPSRVCDLRHSSWQCRILNPLRGLESTPQPHGS